MILPITPAIAATSLNRSFKTFCLHLPFVQLWTHQKKIHDVVILQKDLTEWESHLTNMSSTKLSNSDALLKLRSELFSFLKKCQKRERGQAADGQYWSNSKAQLAKVMDDFTEDLKNISFDKSIEVKNKAKIRDVLKGIMSMTAKATSERKTELQLFKIFAGMLESAPQVVLQAGILLKSLYVNGKLEIDALLVVQLTTSLISVIMTVTSLVTELPVVVHETERPPFRTLFYTYVKILPTVAVSVTPRILGMIAICSFVTLEDWKFYLAFGFCYAGSYLFFTWITNHFVTKSLSFNASMKSKPLRRLSMVTSIISPCVIGVFNSAHYLMSSIGTSILLSIGLGSLCLIGHLEPSLVFKDFRNATVPSQVSSNVSNTEITDDENGYGSQLWYLNWYTMILIPLILLSNLFYYCISESFKRENKIFFPISAVESGGSLELLKGQIAPGKFDFDELIPKDPSHRSLFWYIYGIEDDFTSFLIKNSKSLGINLAKERNQKRKSPLEVSCQEAHAKSIKAAFEVAQQGIDVGLDFKKEEDLVALLKSTICSSASKVAKKQALIVICSNLKLFTCQEQALRVLFRDPWTAKLMGEELAKYCENTYELELFLAKKALKECISSDDVEAHQLMTLSYMEFRYLVTNATYISVKEVFNQCMTKRNIFQLELSDFAKISQDTMLTTDFFEIIDQNFKDIFELACRTKCDPMVAILHQRLIETSIGNDIDWKSGGCLLLAFQNYKEVFKFIMEKFLPDESSNQVKEELSNRLIVACQNGKVEEIATLLEEGIADPNFQDAGRRNFLYHACSRGHSSVVSMLLQHIKQHHTVVRYHF